MNYVSMGFFVLSFLIPMLPPWLAYVVVSMAVGASLFLLCSYLPEALVINFLRTCGLARFAGPTRALLSSSRRLLIAAGIPRHDDGSGEGGERHDPNQRDHRAGSPDTGSLDAITARVRNLPTRMYEKEENPEEMSVRELKALLKSRGKSCVHCCEKVDLVNKVKESSSSSDHMCSICYEDYIANDTILRVLPCNHAFHIECIDRWAFSRPKDDHSREPPSSPTCPLCNQAF